ncbi:leucine rich repeat protein [Plakobranchus ocellatus]|uniref:Leucine rich repeat protein n=1 Tax=Plakobranchus ocellatus TaxID=259542 RepID=A0AAV3Z433_9GAST|nr:leucine rich repeat protein [Plakobranchus ocellatus]
MTSTSILHQTQWMHTAPGLSFSYQDDIAIIKMENGLENRINNQFLEQFSSILDEIEGEPSCKALITTGASKFYSNGLDVDWMSTQSAHTVVDFFRNFQDFLLRMLLFPLPTLAMINGHAFAGGALLAFTHDIRTMNSQKGWICLNEVKMDKVANPFMAQYVRTKLGDGQAFTDSLVLGRRFTAAEALRYHIIHLSSPLSSLAEESITFLESLCGEDGYRRSTLARFKADVFADAVNIYDRDRTQDKVMVAEQFFTEAQKAEMDQKGPKS